MGKNRLTTLLLLLVLSIGVDVSMPPRQEEELFFSTTQEVYHV